MFKKILAGLALGAIALLLANEAHAAIDTDYLPLTNIPGVLDSSRAQNPVLVLSGLYGLAIGIGSVIAVVMIIYAGFKYMYVESIQGKSDAKSHIINAFIGLAVILGSYIFLKTINPDLVKFDLTLQGGSGRLSQLLALQAEYDAVTAGINTANNTYFAAQAQVTAINEELRTINIERATLEGRTDAASVARLAELNAKRDSLLIQANTIAVNSLRTHLEALISSGQDSALLNQVISMETGDRAWYNSIQALMGSKTNAETRLATELTNLSNLPETPNKAELVALATADIVKYQEYLATSKANLSTINSWFTTNTSGTSGRERFTEIDNNLKQLTSQMEATAKTYDSQQSTVTATQMREDIINYTRIVKASVKVACSTSSKNISDLSICQP